MNTSRRYTAEERRRCLALFEYGEDVRKLAHRWGCTPETIYGWARDAGISRHGGNASPLTTAAVHETYVRWTSGAASLEDLAAEHGYRVASMLRLLRRAHKSYGEGECPTPTKDSGGAGDEPAPPPTKPAPQEGA